MTSINRRGFIQKSAIGTTAISLGFCAPKIKNKKKLGVALLGLGSYSTGQLAPGLQMTAHCELRGIITGSPHKIPEWQRINGIKDQNVYSYDNMNEIANNDDIDIVYIVTPTGTHARFSIAAANTGKHVWCEKPMAMDEDECQNIIDACNRNKVKLAIGYRMQHEPNTKTVIKFAKTRPYGLIQNVTAEACYSGSSWQKWRLQKHMGGGALYDMGVYTINGIRYATGEEPVKVVQASQSTKRPTIFTEVDETTRYELEFAGGIKASGLTSVGLPNNKLRVDCEKGWYQLQPMQSYSGVRGETSDGKKLNKPVRDQQARQMDVDALAIINNQPMLVSGEEGQKDIVIVNAIKKASQTGKEVVI